MHIYYENNGDCDRRKCILEMYDIFSIYKIFYVGNHAENDKSAFLGVAKMSNIWHPQKIFMAEAILTKFS